MIYLPATMPEYVRLSRWDCSTKQLKPLDNCNKDMQGACKVGCLDGTRF
jgi:hypothetical protein